MEQVKTESNIGAADVAEIIRAPRTGPRKRRTREEIENKHGIPKAVLDELMSGVGTDTALLTGPDGLLKRLTKALVERMLDEEMNEHVGYEKHEAAGRNHGNSRNGYSEKTLRSDDGKISVKVPRDREGTFTPIIVEKHARSFRGFDEKILAMYARGMSMTDIQSHLAEIYSVGVSPEFISKVTEIVLDELRVWQSRPLEDIYVVVYFDALMVKVRDGGTVKNKAAYVALGITLTGEKDVLGLWVDTSEGAKFWLSILTELKNRGVADIFIACCDGLTGFPEAIETVFHKTIVQTCIVHVIRNSVKYVSHSDKKNVCRDLRKVYTSDTEVAAKLALADFEKAWGGKYPTIAEMWHRNWERIRPFLEFPKEIRKVIYTTNAIESLNFLFRKVIKTKGHFPNDEAALKLLYLAARSAKARWIGNAVFWNKALNYFAIHFKERMPV